MDFHLSRPHILRYWVGTPDQHRQINRLYLSNADWGGTARALPQQRKTFPSAGLRLCFPHRLTLSLPRHGTS